jgi:glycosyltransferase involved in cell wall biosynthesis
MKAIILHPSLNMAGGAERVCLGVIKALRKGGYKVKLVTVEKTSWNLLEKVFGDISKPHEEKFYIENIPHQSALSKAFSTFFFLLTLIQNRFNDNESVTLNTYGNLVDPVADISYIGGVPVRTIYHYPQSGYADSTSWRLLAHIYDFHIRGLQKIFGDNLLLVNSHFIQKIIKRHLKRNSIVVYPPVDIERFKQNTGVRTREDIVVTASRFRKGKSLNVIPTIAKLAEYGKFVIIGIADKESKGLVDKLTQTIQKLGLDRRVELLVNQPRRKLLEILSSAKVYLHTQPMEAFGIAVVEAMAAGCVPVVPRYGGPWLDILSCRQGLYGFSYSSPEEAADIIKKLLRNESLRKSIASKAAQRALQFNYFNFEAKILKVVDHTYRLKNA